MQVNQDLISTFWLTFHGKMPIEWLLNRYCQNRHQRQAPDFFRASISFRSKPDIFHILDGENIIAIIYSRNTASAELQMPSQPINA